MGRNLSGTSKLQTNQHFSRIEDKTTDSSIIIIFFLFHVKTALKLKERRKLCGEAPKKVSHASLVWPAKGRCHPIAHATAFGLCPR